MARNGDFVVADRVTRECGQTACDRGVQYGYRAAAHQARGARATSRFFLFVLLAVGLEGTPGFVRRVFSCQVSRSALKTVKKKTGMMHIISDVRWFQTRKEQHALAFK